MAPTKKIMKTCSEGHTYYKSSDCPVCPICSVKSKPESGFLSDVGAPARRALEGRGITTLTKLSNYSEKEILQLHGVGPSSIPKLKKAMKEIGLSFKNP